MAIEDIIQIKESVKENPMGDAQTVNQAEFLRFQEQMGMGVDGIMAKIIQMFVEEPSEFTRKFGVEAADSVREFLGNQTQRELEGQGQVFAPDSAEIIGQNISMNLPEDSAIGTLQTDQANEAEMMMEFMKKQLRNVDQFRVLSHDEAQTMGLPVDGGKIWQMNEATGKVEVLEGTTAQERHRILSAGEAKEQGLPVDEGQIWELNQMTGQVNLLDTGEAETQNWITKKQGETTDLDSLTEWMEERGLDGLNIDKSHLDRGENTLRVITDEEAEALGFKTGDGKIYQMDETGTVTLKEPGMIESGILKLMDWFKYGRTDPENR